jgi:hypothetical protein
MVGRANHMLSCLPNPVTRSQVHSVGVMGPWVFWAVTNLWAGVKSATWLIRAVCGVQRWWRTFMDALHIHRPCVVNPLHLAPF